METNYKLYDYGIYTEQSDIRAHVGPLAKTVYVYKTQEMINYIDQNKETIPIKYASQQGWSQPTASGYTVPIADLSFIRKVQWYSYPWDTFPPRTASTSERGAAAVHIVCELLRLGRFPLFFDGAEESTDRNIQISGTDIVVTGTHKIQVKCDYPAAPREMGGYGNLYIQIQESNPFKMH